MKDILLSEEEMLEYYGDEYSAAQKEKDLDEKAERLLMDDLRAILQMPEGFRFMAWFLDRLALFNEAFTGNSMTYYILGRQSAARILLGKIGMADQEAGAKLLMHGFEIQEKAKRKGKD
jgi:hypothetical protein